MGVLMLKWLLIWSLMYVSVEGHAYGYRPVAKPVQVVISTSYSAKSQGPGTYSYVRPAARGSTLPRPAATSKYSAPAAVSSSKTATVPAYESGDYTTRSVFYPDSTDATYYSGDTVYYTTESTYYTTTAHSYYAEPIYYSTEPAVYNYGATDATYHTTQHQYTYVDPSTYFAEAYPEQASSASYYDVPADYAAAVAAAYPAAGAASYSGANDYAVAAGGPVEYVADSGAGTSDYATAGPADYAASAPGGYSAAAAGSGIDYGASVPASYSTAGGATSDYATYVPASYSAAAAGGSAVPADYGAAVPADYAASAPASAYGAEAGYNAESAPAYTYGDASAQYTLAAGAEQLGQTAYYAPAAGLAPSVYDAQQGYYTGGNVYVNDYATAVPSPVYYAPDQAAASSFSPVDVQYHA